MLALAVIVGISLYGVVTMPLAEPDEARYAETARQMLETGDWIVPHLEAKAFLDKPPLLYWLSAVSFRVFGVGDASARLPVFVAALCCLLIVFHQARKLFDRDTAWISAAILASSPLFFGMEELLTMDMPLTLWTTAGMAAVWLGSRQDGKRWIQLAYGASAFGVLTKGPIAVVLIWLPAFIYFVGRRDLGPLRYWWDWVAGAVFVLICAPWFWLVNAREAGFISNFLWHHHLERFLNPWHHREPFWFFLPVALVGVLPWSILWIFDPRRSWSVLTDLPRRPEVSYLVLCAAVPFLIFSASSSKLIPYLLPSIPPLAILMGIFYRRLLESRCPAVLSRGGVCFAVAGAATLACGLLFLAWEPHWRVPILRPLLILGGSALLVTGMLSRSLVTNGFRAGALTALLLGTASLLFVIQAGRGGLAKNYRALSMAAHRQLPKDTVIWSVGGYYPAVDFYLQRELPSVSTEDVSTLEDVWKGAHPLAIFVPGRNLAAVRAALPGGRIIAQQRSAAVIYNQGH